MKWICTKPYIGRFGKVISETVFTFAQLKDDTLVSDYVLDADDEYSDEYFDNELFNQQCICLTKYDHEYLLEILINHDYQSIADMKRIYGSDYNFVLAEYIFEDSYNENFPK